MSFVSVTLLLLLRKNTDIHQSLANVFHGGWVCGRPKPKGFSQLNKLRKARFLSKAQLLTPKTLHFTAFQSLLVHCLNFKVLC